MNNLRLKEFRLKAGMTQKTVSESLNVSQSYYSRLEKGNSWPDSKQIWTLCKLFNCTPNDLYGIRGDITVTIDPLFEDYKKLLDKIKK